MAKKIVLDDVALQQARQQFNVLSENMQSLQEEIDKELKELQQGFRTPAGKNFFQACDGMLLQPMKAQAAVIAHVSENLKAADTNYQSVFKEFAALNAKLNN